MSAVANWSREDDLAAQAMAAAERTLPRELFLLRYASAFGLTAGECAKLREVMRLRATVRAKARGTKREQRRIGELLAEVDRALLASKGALIDLEKARGGKVTRFNDAGALRIHSRDGLASLNSSGRISDRELEIGLAYRALYELRTGALRSQLDDRVRRVGDHDGMILARLDAAACTDVLRRLDLAVQRSTRGTACWPGVAELRALRLVAGEGRCAWEFARGGEQMEKAVAALRRALCVIGVGRGFNRGLDTVTG